MRIPSHHFDSPREKQRSRSLDVEALERSGIKILRVVRIRFVLLSFFIENEVLL